ncbi:MAG: lauroyl acyltransferase [Pseudomonadota bacterium]
MGAADESNRGVPAGKRLAWRLEAGLAWGLYGLLRVLPIDWASGLAGAVCRLIGPRLPVSKVARRNLARAFPEQDAAEREAIVRQVWDNLGRTAGELAHLDKITDQGPDARIELHGHEQIETIKRNDAAVAAFTAHLANWDVASLVAGQNDLPFTMIYRRSNNPYVDRLIQRCRAPSKATFAPKEAASWRIIAKTLRRAGNLALLADQKMNNGIAAPFFGRPAMTLPTLAMCKLRYDCRLIPVQVERLEGARFRVTVHPPLEVALSGEQEADMLAITTAINLEIEGWVRQNPGQWLWLHRRWPD